MAAPPDRLSWPLDARQVESLDLMLETIYRRPATGGHTSAAGAGVTITTNGTIDTIAATALSSMVVQVVNTQTGAVATGTTTVPIDDTIPQNTEGDQYMSLTITPKNAVNRLRIDVVIIASPSVAAWLIGSLYQDTTVNALATSANFTETGTANANISFSYLMVAGTVSATTFKVRLGMDRAGTTTFNGGSGTRRFGGALVSSLTITELDSNVGAVGGSPAVFPVAVPQGGTGDTTLTNHGVLLGQGAAAISATAVGATNTVLHGNTGADPSYSAIVEADLALTDVATANVSTTAHGLAPKLPNDATKFLNGVGGYTVPGLPNPITQDLLFTDATYDIGKSGATRPRDFFTSRKLVVGTNFSTGAQLEVGFTNPGVALNLTRNPGAAGDEAFVAGFGYDSGGNQIKLGATAFHWTDTTAASGYASWNVHTSAITGGVQSDVYNLAAWGKNGITFFPADLTVSSAPGASDVVMISNGRLLIGTGPANPNAILEIKGTYTGLSTFAPKGFVVQPLISIPVGLNAFGFDIAIGFTKAASGTHTDIVGGRFEAYSILGSGATVTNASIVKIEGPQSGGTNNYSLWSTGGGIRLQGLGAFVTSDKYVVIDANGNLHVSALGPAS